MGGKRGRSECHLRRGGDLRNESAERGGIQDE